MAVFNDATSELIELLARALLHSLWLGACAAAMVGMALKAVPARRAELRYAIALCGLVAIVLGTIVTAAILHQELMTANVASPSSVVAMGGTPLSVSAVVVGDHGRYGSVAFTGAAAESDVRPHWFEWVALLWAIGVVVVLVRGIVAIGAAGRWRRLAEPLTDHALLAVVADVRRRLAIGSHVRVLVTGSLSSPAVVGAMWPCVLLPAALLSGMDPAVLRMVLAHEFAHVRRYDYLVNILQLIVEALLFFNPAVWWISRQVRQEREACCDAIAAAVGGSTVGYARTLSDLAGTMFGAVPQPALAMAPAGRSSLFDRVRRLLMPHERPAMRVPWYSMCAIAAAAFVLLLGFWRGAQAVAQALSPEQRIAAVEEVRKAYSDVPPAISVDPNAKMTISGIVRTRDGSPLRPQTLAHFNIVSRKGDLTTSQSLDKEGRFSFQERFGTITASITSKDYAPVFHKPLSPDEEGKLPSIEIVVEPGYPSRLDIVDPDGKPISGAKVTGGYPREGGYSLNINLLSDDRGAATIANNAPIPVTLTCIADGFEPDRRERIVLKEGESYRWQLKRSTPAQGTVIDAATKKPIVGARICLGKESGDSMIGWTDWDGTNPMAITDANGNFSLRALRSDTTYTFIVLHDDHRPTVAANVRAGDDAVNVLMDGEIKAAGTILGPLASLRTRDGKRIIEFTNPRELGDHSYYAGRSAVVKESDGRATFAMDDLWPGKLLFTNGGREQAFDLIESRDDIVVDLRPTDDSPVDPNDPTSDLQGMRDVTLIVNAPSGLTAVQGTVKFRSSVGALKNNEPAIVALKDGRATIGMRSPTVVYAEIESVPGYWFPTTMATKIESGDGPITLSVDAKPAGAIYGQLTEADGMPMANAFVSVAVVKSYDGTASGASLGLQGFRTNAEGRYVALPIPIGGEYAMVAFPNQRIQVSAPVKLTAASPTQRIDLAMVKGVTIEGKVIDEVGKPALGAEVQMTYASPYNHSFGGKKMQVDRNGRFQLREFNPGVPGKYELSVRTARDLQSLRWTPTLTERTWTIVLKKGCVLDGTLLDDATGEPVRNVEVVAWGNGVNDLPAESLTDRDGKFRFSNLSPGGYYFGFKGRQAVMPMTATPVDEGINAPVTFRLQPAR